MLGSALAVSENHDVPGSDKGTNGPESLRDLGNLEPHSAYGPLLGHDGEQLFAEVRDLVPVSDFVLHAGSR